MFKRWEKIDIFIAVLFVLTNLSYLLFDPAVFRIFLWALIITGTIRLLFILKKKMFWKVRNRLMFSGLFLIATPIFFVSLFFYLVFNILMAQYGLVFMKNVMDGQLGLLDNTAAYYMEMGKTQRVNNLKEMKRDDWAYFNAVFYEKKENGYQPYYAYPDDYNTDALLVDDFRGFFMLGKTIYYGVLKTDGQSAVLIAETVNQGYLDMLSAISDFRVKYQDPNKDKIQEAIALTDDPELLNDEAGFPIPWTFKYSFIDFNSLVDSKPQERKAHFWLFLNLSKVYKKLTRMDSAAVQNDIKRAIYGLVFIFGFLIVVSFIIGVRSIRVITRSINLITAGTQRIRNGDFSFRIRTRSGDQLQYLGESFNEMAAGIDRLLIEEKEKQRLEEELRIARSIQLKLLPPDAFETDEFELAAVNIPAAEIAGDYFDYFYEKDDYLSLLVADVSGKGSSAAFYMAELKGVINHLQKEQITPATLISECHFSLKSSFDRVTFITMNMAKCIIPEKKFLFARAGHTPALFYSAETRGCEELYPKGVAIGLINFSEDKIDEIEISYKKGDILFLFSDGLSEIMNDEEEMLGVENLKRIICNNHHLSAEEIKQHLLDFSIRFSENEINRDDLTFIILKVK